MEKHEKMLQEMMGYTDEQLVAEMDAAEEEWKQSGSPRESEEQTKESFNRMIEKIESR